MIIYGIQYGPKDNYDDYNAPDVETLYITKESAQKKADKLNEQMINIEKEFQAKVNKAYETEITEHKALVKLGLRKPEDFLEKDVAEQTIEEIFQYPWIWYVVEIKVHE